MDNWISVDERLPEFDYLPVLVYSTKHHACIVAFVVDGKWYIGRDRPTGLITHWQPLPGPPEVQQ